MDPIVQNPDFGYTCSFLVDSHAYVGKTIIIYAQVGIVFNYDLQTWIEVRKIKIKV